MINTADNLPLATVSSEIEAKYSYFSTRNIDTSTQSVLQKNFKSVAGHKVPFALDENIYWVKIAIENKTNEILPLILHADNPMLEVFTVFSIEEKASRQLNDFDKTDNTLTKEAFIFPHIPFEIQAKATSTLLVKLHTLGPPNVPLILYKSENFNQRIELSHLIFGAFIGIILMFACYNVVIYFAVKDKVYLAYIGYLLSSFFVLAGINGFGYYVFPLAIQNLIRDLTIQFDGLLVIFLSLFTLYFLRYDIEKKLAYQCGITLVTIMSLFTCLSLFLNPIDQALYFFSMQPFFYIFSISIITLRLRKDFKWARFYFISWIPLLIGAAIQPLLLMNKIDYSFLARNAFLFSVLIEITFMAFALAERVKRNEQDRIKDMLYHTISAIPRKLLIRNKITELVKNYQESFDVMVIKPEQIDTVNLYLSDKENALLFKKLCHGLSSLFAYNDAIISLDSKSNKVCLLDDNTLVILINNSKTKQSLDILIQSIQNVINLNYKVEQLEIPLSAIIGIASFPSQGHTSNKLLNRARQALKQAGFNQKRWASFEIEKSDKTEYLLKLASEIRAALVQEEFEVYHQPQIDLKTQRVCGSECLIRWNHPKEGYISPPVFVEVAEDMGLINALTLWVIKTSLKQHELILESGFSHHMLSINISGKDICSDNFFDNVVSILNESTIPPDKIIFELTESATITNSEQAMQSITQFTEMGVSISIDDFGTGYSSMAYITTLPFNELKIDRQFVENVCDSRKRRTIAETTTKMAKGLGLEVVAEGINSIEDEDAMRGFGADIGQGYFYAKPMPLALYIEWLSQQKHGKIPHSEGQFIPAS